MQTRLRKQFTGGVFLALLVLSGMAACKKIIQTNLADAASRIVIQGNVTDGSGPFEVRISRTVSFAANNTFPPVTGAMVNITDTLDGQSEQLFEVDSGVYSTLFLTGFSLHTYFLDVRTDGQEYTASSTMPRGVALDSVTLEENVDFNNKKEINAVVNFQDPKGVANYYQFTETVNGRALPDIFVFDDRLSDGKYIRAPLFNDSAYLQIGDTLVLTMNCVDQNIYDYFFTLAAIVGNNGSQSTSPANPITNISNGALGYFSAHTSSFTSVVIY